VRRHSHLSSREAPTLASRVAARIAYLSESQPFTKCVIAFRTTVGRLWVRPDGEQPDDCVLVGRYTFDVTIRQLVDDLGEG